MYPCFLLQCLSGLQDILKFLGFNLSRIDLDSFRHRLTQGCAFWNKAVISFPASAGTAGERPKWAGKFEGKPTLHCRSVSSNPCGAKFQWPLSYDQDDEKTVTELRWILRMQSWSKRSQVIVSRAARSCLDRFESKVLEILNIDHWGQFGAYTLEKPLNPNWKTV